MKYRPTPHALVSTILLQGTASANGHIAVEDNGARALSTQEPR